MVCYMSLILKLNASGVNKKGSIHQIEIADLIFFEKIFLFSIINFIKKVFRILRLYLERKQLLKNAAN